MALVEGSLMSVLGLAATLVSASLSMTAYAQGTTLKYEQVKAIVDQNCVTCHKPSGPAGFLPLTSLGEIKGNHEAMLSALDDDYMPMGRPGFKDTPDGVKLREWLAEGSDLRDPPSPPPGPPPLIVRDPRQLRYEDLKPIIDRHCVGCHNPNGRQSRLPLTNLAQVRRQADDMWDQLDEGSMPLGDAEFRFTQEGRALMGWLRYGLGGD